MKNPPIRLMVAGAHKAGTTSLKDYLGQHPDIATHDQTEYCGFLADVQYAKGYDATFRQYFPEASPGHSTIIAKCIEVMYQPKMVQRLYEHNPDCRIVLLLRHPIDRAYSAYWYLRCKAWEESPSFEQALAEEPERLRSNNIRVFSGAYLNRSTYYKHLANLYNTFGEHRVQVFLVDDLKKDPAAVCRKIFEAAGVDGAFTPSFERRSNAAALSRSVELTKMMTSDNDHFLRAMIRPFLPSKLRYTIRKALLSLNEKPFTPPPMKPETRQRLIEYFLPHNGALSSMLDRPLHSWNR
ncbi:sulfotransferase domain-containing protein [Gloeobacter violaceus]|uniref:Glr0465 protein n=1 Tax=Gloeobacter violaceus (strain ATCC 29082 / PCC 7421) TaxID=251221 RepID=Q7NNE6_GLOVI|nr:sulfotransferase domain-containing protein [Gloeobacter violaceus]BAC88406.1 glr0465 [Gloeobacter violaceus PCC 7421]